MKVDPAEFPLVFARTLAETAELLESLGAPYMLIGGLAVAVRSRPRATKDVDFAALVDAEGARRLLDGMAALGYAARVHGAPGPGAVFRFVRAGPDGFDRWVDVLCAGTPFEEEAIDRATRHEAVGRVVPIASAEDLIVFKLVAARPDDLADVARLLEDNAGRLDEAYLDARAAEWESSDLLRRLREKAGEE